MSEVFGASPDKVEVQEPDSYLEKFMEEGKTIEEIAEGLAKKAFHADNFIETLKNEKAALQSSHDELNTKLRTTDEIMAAIAKTPEPEPYVPIEEPKPVVEDKPTGTYLTEEDLEAKLQEMKERADRDKEVNDKFWSDVTTGLNCSVEEARAKIFQYVGEDENKKNVVTTLGVSDPASLVQILQGVKVETLTREPSNSTPVVPVKAEEVLTWSKCLEVKKTDPVRYQSPEFQKKKLNAVRTIPNFYNT